jgi:hypothetical protein
MIETFSMIHFFFTNEVDQNRYFQSKFFITKTLEKRMDCYPSLINHKSYHDMSNITLDLFRKFLRNEKK